MYYWENDKPENRCNISEPPYNITGLQPNKAYKIVIAAFNSEGSTNSSTVDVKTMQEGVIISL